MLVCLLYFGFHITSNNLSVIPWQCLDVAGSSMLPHWDFKPQTHVHPVIQSLYTDTALTRPDSWLYFHNAWAPSERAASTIFEVVGMTHLWIERTTCQTQSRQSLPTEPLCQWLGHTVLGRVGGGGKVETHSPVEGGGGEGGEVLFWQITNSAKIK